MRKLSLYPKLAASAIRKNIRIYLPYLLACTGTVMMFNLLLTLCLDSAVSELRGGRQIQLVLTLGCVVVALFSAVLLFYTNGVIIRQRKREFGLYNILGMEKRHIALVLLWETFYAALISFVLGVSCALAFSKLMQMLILRMLGSEVNLIIRFNAGAALGTMALFLAIFLLTLMKNVAAVHRARPTELLRSANEGEREPKSRWLCAVLGVVTLGAGYLMALRVDDVYNALELFFVAVILVIAGTYLLFTAFSVVLLKSLRKNRNYYYKTNHFVSVSGMIYRMKRNAAGLASICVLSTMVLVTVSTTFSLYAGLEDVVDARYPTDMSCNFLSEDTTPESRAAAMERIYALAAAHGVEVTDAQDYASLTFAVAVEDDGATLNFSRNSDPYANRLIGLSFLTAQGFSRTTGMDVALQPNEALCYDDRGIGFQTMNIGELTLSMRPLESVPALFGRMDGVERNVIVVVRDMDVLERIAEIERVAYDHSASTIRYKYRFNLKGSEDDVIAYQEDARRFARENDHVPSVYAKQVDYYEDYVSMYGSLFFLGMFLGLLFIMTTVTIMYYKQVSEGMDDQGRYAVLQKVGMTRAEVRSAIRSQVLTVFFLPLGTAAVHVAFAFPMVNYILQAFGMMNTRLFALSTLGCFGIFAILYIAVYLLTARAYYRIVDNSAGSAR